MVYFMDALEILREVSDAYRRLRTLSLSAIQLTESGDENASTSSRMRMRFLYASPDRIRFEQLGNRGMLQVADGENVHTLFPRLPMSNGPRYSSMPASRMPFPPHCFRSEFPLSGDAAFLFTGIEEHVESAEVVRQEDGCFVVSVQYAPSTHASVIVHGSPVFFWVRTDNRMVMRQQARIGHRPPTEDDIHWSSHTISVERLTIDEDLPEHAFRFTPPPGATSAGCGVSGGGGGGFIENSGADAKRVEHRGSHSWEGDTLVEQSRWKMRGLVLQFERRLSFSADGTELRVGERISGPRGTVEGVFDVPLD
jgi:outer membrane lipoprotein-sorting protein